MVDYWVDCCIFLFWSLSSPWDGPGRILGGPVIDVGKAGECHIVIKAITGMITMPIVQISSAPTVCWVVGCVWWGFWSLLSPREAHRRILGGPAIDRKILRKAGDCHMGIMIIIAMIVMPNVAISQLPTCW